MRIVIVGGGVVGYSLAEQLLQEKHTVSLVEPDRKIADDIASKMDLQVIAASGSSPAALEDAGIRGADMVIAVTPLDEVNFLVCNIARHYEVPMRIARLRSTEFISSDRHVGLEELGVTDFIFPEKVVVDAIGQYIETPGSFSAVNFEDGEILLRGYLIREGMPIVGQSLIDIRQVMENELFLIAAVIRDGRGIIPPGDFIIEPGDRVYSLFPRSAIPSFLGLLSAGRREAKRVVLTGDNLSSRELATVLQEKVSSVTYIDRDRKRAEETALLLDKTDVIHGDCTDIETLKEVDINRADFFVAASNEADYNMLSALLAKAEGAREVIAVSTEFRHDRLFHSLGIDHVINPRMTAAREIMQIISRGHFGSIVRLGEADIEAIRVTVPENSNAIGKPLSSLWKKLRKGAIVGIVIHGESMIIPDGETVLEAGDHVICIAYTKFLPVIEKLFKNK